MWYGCHDNSSIWILFTGTQNGVNVKVPQHAHFVLSSASQAYEVEGAAGLGTADPHIRTENLLFFWQNVSCLRENMHEISGKTAATPSWKYVPYA